MSRNSDEPISTTTLILIHVIGGLFFCILILLFT